MFCVQNGQLHGPSFYEYYKPESADKIILQFKLKLEFLLSGNVKRMCVKGQMFFCDCFSAERCQVNSVKSFPFTHHMTFSIVHQSYHGAIATAMLLS